jgi:hypothetical protein
MKQETTTKKKMIGTLKLTIENNKMKPKGNYAMKVNKRTTKFSTPCTKRK